MEPPRSQLQYPLDAESLATLKNALPTPLKELARVQAITLVSGDVSFDVRNTDGMSVSASGAVTIATITNGYSGQILTLLFNDANVTITDTSSGARGTINLNGAFTSAANAILQLFHNGTSWVEVDRSTADVGGPATSTDNAIARWDGTTGNLLQDSIVKITDLGNIQLGGSATGILDASGNEHLFFNATLSAVNHFTMGNASTGNSPLLSATGDDTNVNFRFLARGTGVFAFEGTADTQAVMRLYEDLDNGTNYIAIQPPASLAADWILTLPANDGDANQFLQTNGSGTTIWATSGERRIVILPGNGFLTGSAIVQSISFSTAIEFSDAAQEDWTAQGVVPDGADGLGISSIEVIFNNQDAGTTKNVVLRVETVHWDYSAGGTRTADSTGTERAYATGGTGNNTTGIFTLNSDVYNALPSPMSKGDIVSVNLRRVGDSASDTYNGIALQVLAIYINFA